MIGNIAKVKIGIVAVSRDCFPIELSKKRRENVLAEAEKQNVELIKIDTIIENENDVVNVLDEIKEKGINSLFIYLGNFGPEGPISLLAQKFTGPVMVAGAAEETGKNLISGRGDAYCGMLSTSYNLNIRNASVYIPHYPIGMPDEIVNMIKDFIPIARTILSLKNLKIFSFGPRPQDFVAVNAPIKPLYDLGVEIMENSELDLYDIYKSVEGSSEIDSIVKDMEKELGSGNRYPDLLSKLAQYELALTQFFEKNLGVSQFGVFANKCWPSFEKYFTFVPCFVNSRLAGRGIPVSCEADIYGVLSEYIATAASNHIVTLLDINNSVPYDMIEENKEKVKNYKYNDLFMGFHCGNTNTKCMVNYAMRYQLIMHRLMEPDKPENITRGTIEGRIRPGDITIYRLQSGADGELKTYMAEGEVLDIEPKSFGSIGVFAVKEMGRFYRYVMLGNQFPHHSAIGFKHIGKTLFEVAKLLNIKNIFYNLPEYTLYKDENPFAD